MFYNLQRDSGPAQWIGLCFAGYKHRTPNGVQDNSSNLIGLLCYRNCFLSAPIFLHQVYRTIGELEEMRMGTISVS
jgi:hypothetical protein